MDSADENVRISPLDELVEARRDALERRHPRWEPKSLAVYFDTVAADYPERPCVITDGRTLSYADIREWSCELARGLISLGIEPGEHVAVIMDNRPEFVALKLAIARIGAVAVPLNYQYRTEELGAVLKHSDAAVLITMESSWGRSFLEALDELIGAGWEQGVESPAFPHLRKVILSSSSGRAGALDLEGLRERGRGVPEAQLKRREQDIDPDSVCDVVYTSGTTGHPLGAVLTHDMLLRSAYGSAFTRAFEDGRRIIFSLPLYHVFGYVEGLLAALCVGGAIIPQQIFNPKSILQAVERHRANEALFVPTMSVAVVEQASRSGFDLSSLEAVMSAAAVAPVWLWQRVKSDLGVGQTFTGYGQTEVSAATALTFPQDPIELISATVGRCKLGGVAGDPKLDRRLAEYRTIDPFTQEPLPPGSEGELVVRGPIVTHGYYNNPERTRELISPEGWLRTGDLGRVRSDGYLELTGRSSELYKCGGELVAPKEVEELITGHPAVAQAYVAGVPDERLGEVGWAWVVPVEDHEVTSHEIISYCITRLARFKVPRKVSFVSAEELPTTPTGKVQKFRLVEQAAE